MAWVKPKLTRLRELKAALEKLREIQMQENEEKLKRLKYALDAKAASTAASR